MHIYVASSWRNTYYPEVFVLIPDKDSYEPELMYKLFTKVCISMEELMQKL